MSRTDQIAIELGKLDEGMKGRAKLALGKVALDLINEFGFNSPVASGIFRAEWDFKEESVSGNVIAAISVFNRMPYAAVIDKGTKKGQAPWPSAGRELSKDEKSAKKQKPPKTIEKDGRIWSTQAIGGVTGPVLDAVGYIDNISDEILNFTMGEF